MRRQVDAAVSKDASNVRPFRQDIIVTRYEGKIRIVFVEEALDLYGNEGLRHV
jgi:hypothetical protein